MFRMVMVWIMNMSHRLESLDSYLLNSMLTRTDDLSSNDVPDRDGISVDRISNSSLLVW